MRRRSSMTNPPRFDHHEIKSGSCIGCGQFGTVSEVIQIKGNFGTKFQEKNTCSFSSGRIKDLNENDNDTDEISGVSFENLSLSSLLVENGEDMEKNLISMSVIRKSHEQVDRYRYAIKRIRSTLDKNSRMRAVRDLKNESNLLRSLFHPNIVKLRGTVGIPGSPDFMLIMDRLYDTVGQRIQQWKEQTKKNVPFRGLRYGSKNRELQRQLGKRLAVAYDLARALRYLHKHRIIHRDLKPQNAAFTARGEVRLFDFGLSKQLRQDLLIQGDDGYKCTAMMGSPRWMAPEVFYGLPYGLSADVYSFGLLLWNLCSLKSPYGEKLNMEKLKYDVVIKGERPKHLCFVPDRLNNLMSNCWDRSPSKRPSCEEICLTLENEAALQEEINEDLLDRTTHLLDDSERSMSMRLPSQILNSSSIDDGCSIPIARIFTPFAA